MTTTLTFATYDLVSDTAVNRPASPKPAGGRLLVFQATDTGTVSLWNGTAWVDLLANAAAGKVLTSGTPSTWTATPSVTSITFGSGTALSSYVEGTYTPTDVSGAGLTFTVSYAKYVRIGNVVEVTIYITFPATTDTRAILISLPFTIATDAYPSSMCQTNAGSFGVMALGLSAAAAFIAVNVTSTATSITNNQLSSTFIRTTIVCPLI